MKSLRSRITLSITAAIVVGIIAALIAWVGGYDFDTRGVNVAFYAGNALVLALAAGASTFALTEP